MITVTVDLIIAKNTYEHEIQAYTILHNDYRQTQHENDNIMKDTMGADCESKIVLHT